MICIQSVDNIKSAVNGHNSSVGTASALGAGGRRFDLRKVLKMVQTAPCWRSHKIDDNDICYAAVKALQSYM